MTKVRYLFLFLIIVFMGIFILGCSSEKEKEVENTALPDSLPEFVLESDFDVIDWDRQAVEFEGMVGNQKMVGIIGADMPSLDGQKWMWHLWGVDEAIDRQLTVVGYHKETGTVHPVLMSSNDGWSTTLGGENNGADAHIPSSVQFAEQGEWALLLYVDEELFDILVLNINE